MIYLLYFGCPGNGRCLKIVNLLCYGFIDTRLFPEKFLPEPDLLKRNPHSSAYPIQIWYSQTVEDAMQSEAFKAAFQKVEREELKGAKAQRKRPLDSRVWLCQNLGKSFKY